MYVVYYGIMVSDLILLYYAYYQVSEVYSILSTYGSVVAFLLQMVSKCSR